MAFSVANVAKETGIAKEVLRKWETRYGFPVPDRDAAGDRLYSEEQVARLRLIKKLIDGGMRPGQVVPLNEAELKALSLQSAAGTSLSASHPVVDWLKQRQPSLVHAQLRAELERLGLNAFAMDLMPQMNDAVGWAWARAELSVHEEHLYTEIVQNLVRQELGRLAPSAGKPGVLLTTVPEELHTLGILMVESVLTIAGARCVSLGAQTPLPEIVAAAQGYDIDIVALSFSAAYPRRRALAQLKELRALLPDNTALWAGGAGVRDLERVPRGVTTLDRLPEVVQALEKFGSRAPVRKK